MIKKKLNFFIYIFCIIFFLFQNDATAYSSCIINSADRIERINHIDIYAKYNVTTPNEIIRLIIVYPSNVIMMNVNKKIYVLTNNIKKEKNSGCFFVNIYSLDDFIQSSLSYEMLLKNMKIFKKRLYVSHDFNTENVFNIVDLLRVNKMIYISDVDVV